MASFCHNGSHLRAKDHHLNGQYLEWPVDTRQLGDRLVTYCRPPRSHLPSDLGITWANQGLYKDYLRSVPLSFGERGVILHPVNASVHPLGKSFDGFINCIVELLNVSNQFLSFLNLSAFLWSSNAFQKRREIFSFEGFEENLWQSAVLIFQSFSEEVQVEGLGGRVLPKTPSWPLKRVPLVFAFLLNENARKQCWLVVVVRSCNCKVYDCQENHSSRNDNLFWNGNIISSIRS